MTDANNRGPVDPAASGDEEAITEIIEEDAKFVLPDVGAEGSAKGSAPSSAPTGGRDKGAASAAPAAPTQPYPRKMVISAFVLGIVGTSLAVLALILGFVNLGLDGGHGPREHSRVTITEDFDERGGRMTERFSEDFDGRGGRMTERFSEDFEERGTGGGKHERMEITEETTDDTENAS